MAKRRNTNPPVSVKEVRLALFFKQRVCSYFKSSKKTGWGKNEVERVIGEEWEAFLEEAMK